MPKARSCGGIEPTPSAQEEQGMPAVTNLAMEESSVQWYTLPVTTTQMDQIFYQSITKSNLSVVISTNTITIEPNMAILTGIHCRGCNAQKKFH